MKRILLWTILFTLTCTTPEKQYKEEPVPQKESVQEDEKPLPKKQNSTGEKKAYSIDDLFNIAVGSTERLAIKREGVIQAEARKSMFFGNFFPTLSYRYQKFINIPDHTDHDRDVRNRNNLYKAYTGDPNTPYNPFYTSQGSSSTSVSPALRPGSRLVLHIPIMTGTSEWANYKIANAEVNAKKFEMKDEAGKLYLEIAQTYFTILQLEKNLQNKKKLLQIAKESEAEIDYRVALGKNRRSESYGAKSNIARLDAEILGLSDQLVNAKEDLAFLTGVENEIILSDEVEEVFPNFGPEELDKKIESRADISFARANLEMSKAEVLKAWGGHMPTVSIDSFYTFAEKNQPQNKDIFNQIVLQVPLLSLGTVSSAIKQAESAKRQSELQLTRIIKKAKDEARKAFYGYRTSILEADAYLKASQAAEESYHSVVRDYNKKMATQIEVLNALTAYQNAKEDYERIVLQKKLNSLWLKIALGEYPDVKENLK